MSQQTELQITSLTIPASIVKAICAVMSEVTAVKKSQRNQHGNYNYASTDDIYAAVARKMGDVGLVCLGMEGEVEIVSKENKGKDGVSNWLKAVYYFVLSTESDTFVHPHAKRTVVVQITGPQTFQAAQSYAEKSFLRSLFKLPTGDMDLDDLPENFEYQNVLSRQPAPIPEIPVDIEVVAVTADATDADAVLSNLRRVLGSANTESDLRTLWDAGQPDRKLAFSAPEHWEAADKIKNDNKERLGLRCPQTSRPG